QGWVLDVGHAAGSVVSVQVADLDRVVGGADEGGLSVAVGPPTDAWWRLVLGGPPTPAQRHVLAGSCAKTTAIALFSAHDLVGGGRAVVVDDHLHLSVLTVPPELRRRGYGTALLA